MDVLGVGRRRAPVSGESSATEIVSFLGTHDHHPLSVPTADYFRSLERPRVALFSALVSLYPFRDCVRMWARRSSQLMASIFVVQRWQYKKIHVRFPSVYTPCIALVASNIFVSVGEYMRAVFAANLPDFVR